MEVTFFISYVSTRWLVDRTLVRGGLWIGFVDVQLYTSWSKCLSLRYRQLATRTHTRWQWAGRKLDWLFSSPMGCLHNCRRDTGTHGMVGLRRKRTGSCWGRRPSRWQQRPRCWRRGHGRALQKHLSLGENHPASCCVKIARTIRDSIRQLHPAWWHQSLLLASGFVVLRHCSLLTAGGIAFIR